MQLIISFQILLFLFCYFTSGYSLLPKKREHVEGSTSGAFECPETTDSQLWLRFQHNIEWDEEAMCYLVGSQGPCPAGHRFIPKPGSTTTTTFGICEEGDLRRSRSGGEKKRRQKRDVYGDSMSGDVNQNRCPSGERWSNGKCRRVLPSPSPIG